MVGSTVSFSSTNFLVGDFSGAVGSYRQSMLVSEILIYNRILTGAESNTINQGLVNKYIRPLSNVTDLFFDGDSITTGYTGTAMASAVLPYLTGPWQVEAGGAHFGKALAESLVSGTATPISYTQLQANWPGRKKIVVMWLGTNDLSVSISPTTVYNEFVALSGSYQAAGAQTLAMTVLPRGNTLTSAFETARQSFNALVVADTTHFSAVLDVSKIVVMGTAGASGNTTYYNGDFIHPTATGSALIASYLGPLINSMALSPGTGGTLVATGTLNGVTPVVVSSPLLSATSTVSITLPSGGTPPSFTQAAGTITLTGTGVVDSRVVWIRYSPGL